MKKSGLIFSISLGLFFALWVLYIGINPLFISSHEEKELIIPPGAGATAIGRQLENEGIIKSRYAFRLYCSLTGSEDKFKPGRVILSPSMGYLQMIDKLKKSVKSSVRVVIPEGYELREIASALQEKGLIKRQDFFEEIKNGSFDYAFISDRLPAGENRLEGYLFPDTYEFEPGTGEHEIINQMLKRFSEIYSPALSERAKELGLSTHEAITLASIIEKESTKERETVSSVFHNRLHSNYNFLESCATVLYVKQERKERLSLDDTKINSPYNTYINRGLPPGPIASPGKAAIMAALYPAKTDYMYFASVGDGRNVFSKTYEEHLAVAR